MEEMNVPDATRIFQKEETIQGPFQYRKLKEKKSLPKEIKTNENNRISKIFALSEQEERVIFKFIFIKKFFNLIFLLSY